MTKDQEKAILKQIASNYYSPSELCYAINFRLVGVSSNDILTFYMKNDSILKGATSCTNVCYTKNNIIG